MEAGDNVIDYLARYNHCTAISNELILTQQQGELTFHYKDYQDYNRWRVMHLCVEEFIRRFLLHVLPKGLVRIQHSGFLANACRAKQLPRIHQAIAEVDNQPVNDHDEEKPLTSKNVSNTWCFNYPTCHRPMRILTEIPPVQVRYEVG